MKIYKEVLIETADQVERLAEGTFLVDISEGLAYFDASEGSAYEGEFVDFKGNLVHASGLVGCTAYIPVDIEERIGAEMCHQITDKRYDIHVLPASSIDQSKWQIENNPDYATGRIMRQYQTPWEEV